MFAQVAPPHRWDEDSDFHYLRLTLVGFEEKDVVLNRDKYGHLVVRGDREVGENEYITFEETFEVPKDADNLDEASGFFENNNQTYCITIPKKRQLGQAAGRITRSTAVSNIPRLQGKKPVQDNNPRALDNKKAASSINRHPSNIIKPSMPLKQQQQQGSLQVVMGDESKKIKKIGFSMALLIALIVASICRFNS